MELDIYAATYFLPDVAGSEKKTEKYVETEKYFFPRRYLVAFLVCLGNTCLLLMRTNVSIAVVDMTSDKNLTMGNQTVVKKADFTWSSKEKGLILSLFWYGFLLSPLFGGIMVGKYGGWLTFGFSTLATAILTILSPLVLDVGYVFYIPVRIAEGIFEGIANSAYIQVFVFWAAPHERVRMVAVALNGVSFGVALSNFLSGFITHIFSWKAIFFVSGLISFVWSCIWLIFVSENPTKNRFISPFEKEYLKNTMTTLKDGEEKIFYPWKKILTSKPLWALINEYFSIAWSFSFILFCLPLYIKDVHNVDIQQIGIISAIPPLCTPFGELGGAFVANYLRSKTKLSIPTIHRVFILIGQGGTLIALLLVTFCSNFVGSIVLFSIIRICFGIAHTTYTVLHIDMFARYAGLVKAMTTASSSISNLLNPIVMGFMVTNHTMLEWNFYFLFISAFNIWGIIIFMIYGSGELQEWAAVARKSAIDCDEN